MSLRQHPSADSGVAAPRRVGLLGGSFDPPHRAHRALGRLAQSALDLDELRWLPAGRPWQKAGQRMAAPEHRIAMLRALLAEAPALPGAECIDTREIARQGPSYTIDTVRELQAESVAAGTPTTFFLIIGQDQYGRIDTWQRWPELLDLVSLAVAARDGETPCAPAALATHPGHDPSRVHVLPLPRLDIAARDIRRRLAAGQAIDALVGPAVAGYIARHGLYRDPSDNDSPSTR